MKRHLKLLGAMSILTILLIPALTTPAGASTRNLPVGSVVLSGSDWLGGRGVDVYGNGPLNEWNQWQCVELVNRLYATNGWVDSHWSGNGNQKYDTAPPALRRSPQGAIHDLGPGDVLVWNDGGYGHVGVVDTVAHNGGTTRTVVSVNQNTSSVKLTHTWNTSTNSITGGLGGYSLLGVVHAPENAGTSGHGGPVFNRWQSSAGGRWDPWNGAGGTLAAITVDENADGRLEVWGVGTDGIVFNRWQTTPGGNWSNWHRAGGTLSDLDLGRNADGRLEVWGIGN